MLRLSVVAAFVILTGARAESLPIRVRIVPQGGLSPVAALTVVAEPSAYLGGDARQPKRQEQSARPGEVTLDLAPGLWTLTAQGQGIWSSSQDLLVSSDGSAADATLRLWPLGYVTGRLAAVGGAETPTEMKLHIAASPHVASAEDRPPESLVPCAVATNLAFRCPAPATRLDLQLRIKRYVPRYLWDVVVKSGVETDVGSQPLIPGGSISGYVRTASGAAAVGCSLVLATPRDAEPISIDSKPQIPISTGERGFFQFKNVPPGNYQVVANSPGSADASVALTVIKDMESALVEPLVLRPPITMAIRLTPPTSPYAKPWLLSVLRGHTGVLTAVATDVPVAKNGTWRRARTSPGPYTVLVSAALGEKWLTKKIQVASDSRVIDLGVPVLQVEGVVKLGDAPLEARLLFGGRHRSTKVPLRADSEGSFSGAVPGVPGEKLEVYVEATEPAVSRTVSVELPPEGTLLEINLPNTALVGILVDPKGNPVTKAAVALLPVDFDGAREQRIFNDEKGQFRFDGLAAGLYSLTATAPGMQSSEVAVTVKSEGRPTPVRVTLFPERTAVLRVVSTEGEPVAGARVLWRCSNSPYAEGTVANTELDGTTPLRCQAGTKILDVVITSDGFAGRIARLPIVEGSARGTLDHSDGSLRIELPEPEGKDFGWVTLHSSGSNIAVAYLTPWATKYGGGGLEGGRVWVLPHMAAASYKACAFLGTDERCGEEGVLPSGGELTLKVPRKR